MHHWNVLNTNFVQRRSMKRALYTSHRKKEIKYVNEIRIKARRTSKANEISTTNRIKRARFLPRRDDVFETRFLQLRHIAGQTTEYLIGASNLRSQLHFINGKRCNFISSRSPDLSCDFNTWFPWGFPDDRFHYCSLMTLHSRF